ncbi:hypothetical protein B0O99DRAFT_17510 [Bisporella sp. PMI_857]|nr:hypothetical protein B0O99DRAFT_17510 [Bisporella sp. PMI_857]
MGYNLKLWIYQGRRSKFSLSRPLYGIEDGNVMRASIFNNIIYTTSHGRSWTILITSHCHTKNVTSFSIMKLSSAALVAGLSIQSHVSALPIGNRQSVPAALAVDVSAIQKQVASLDNTVNTGLKIITNEISKIDAAASAQVAFQATVKVQADVIAKVLLTTGAAIQKLVAPSIAISGVPTIPLPPVPEVPSLLDLPTTPLTAPGLPDLPIPLPFIPELTPTPELPSPQLPPIPSTPAIPTLPPADIVQLTATVEKAQEIASNLKRATAAILADQNLSAATKELVNSEFTAVDAAIKSFLRPVLSFAATVQSSEGDGVAAIKALKGAVASALATVPFPALPSGVPAIPGFVFSSKL